MTTVQASCDVEKKRSLRARASDFLRRLALNPEIGRTRNLYHVYDVDDDHPTFVQVGRGDVSSVVHCGEVIGHITCHENHDGVVIDGVHFTGKAVVEPIVASCGRLECPVCFLRESRQKSKDVAQRLKEYADLSGGEIVSVSISPPEGVRGLPPEVLERIILKKVMPSRKGLGGVLIHFHGRRINRKTEKLGWSIHWHYLGFVEGGAEICRNCVHTKDDCLKCSCVRGRQMREYAKDGWIFKVEAKRKTVEGTAFYFLNHCTVKHSLFKKSHVTRWFGCCSTRRLKASKHVDNDVHCPACKEKGVDSLMHKEAYYGSKCKNCLDSGFRRVFAADDFNEFGEPNFPSVVVKDEKRVLRGVQTRSG